MLEQKGKLNWTIPKPKYLTYNAKLLLRRQTSHNKLTKIHLSDNIFSLKTTKLEGKIKKGTQGKGTYQLNNWRDQAWRVNHLCEENSNEEKREHNFESERVEMELR